MQSQVQEGKQVFYYIYVLSYWLGVLDLMKNLE